MVRWIPLASKAQEGTAERPFTACAWCNWRWLATHVSAWMRAKWTMQEASYRADTGLQRAQAACAIGVVARRRCVCRFADLASLAVEIFSRRMWRFAHRPGCRSSRMRCRQRWLLNTGNGQG